jgi:hypothetical protein
MGSTRMIVTLSDEDRCWLQGYSQANRISMAEAVRRGMESLRKAQAGTTYQDLLQRTRGTWKRGDGLEYQRRLRSEWADR